jgi:PST family polysaccharide transporter
MTERAWHVLDGPPDLAQGGLLGGHLLNPGPFNNGLLTTGLMNTSVMDTGQLNIALVAAVRPHAYSHDVSPVNGISLNGIRLADRGVAERPVDHPAYDPADDGADDGADDPADHPVPDADTGAGNVEDREELGRKIRSGALWGGIRTLSMRLANIAVMAVVARIISPEAFGIFAVAVTVHTVVSSIGDLGVASMLARGDIDMDEYAPTVATISMISSLILAGLMVVFASPIAGALGTRAAAGPVRVMALAVILVGVFAVPGFQLTREFRQDKQFLATIISFVPGNGVLLLLASGGVGALAFAWSRVAGQLVMGLAIVVLVGRTYWPGFRRSVVRPLLVFGLPLAGANLLNYTLLNTDYVFVGHLLGPTKLGIYLLAFNIASWSTSLLSGMINSVAMPAFSRLNGPGELAAGLVKAFRGIAFLAFPITGVTLALAHPLVVTVYGQKWAAAAPVLGVLTGYGAISVLCLLLSNVLVGQGRTRMLLYVQIYWLAVLVPGMAIGVRFFGLIGAGYAHIIVIGLLVAPVYVYVLRKATGLRPVHLLTAIAPAALASTAAGVAAALVASTLGPSWAKLIAGAAVAGLVYLLLALGELGSIAPAGLLARTPLGGMLAVRDRLLHTIPGARRPAPASRED